jgi:hypothetical protein
MNVAEVMIFIGNQTDWFFRRTGFDLLSFDYEGRSIKVISDTADGTC